MLYTLFFETWSFIQLGSWLVWLDWLACKFHCSPVSAGTEMTGMSCHTQPVCVCVCVSVSFSFLSLFTWDFENQPRSLWLCLIFRWKIWSLHCIIWGRILIISLLAYIILGWNNTEFIWHIIIKLPSMKQCRFFLCACQRRWMLEQLTVTCLANHSPSQVLPQWTASNLQFSWLNQSLL